MIRGALKLGMGVGRMGLGAAGALMTPLMVPMAASSTIDLLEKMGYDPTGDVRRKKAPYRGAALEEAILEGKQASEEKALMKALQGADDFDQELVDLIQKSMPRLQSASRPMTSDHLLNPMAMMARRGMT